MSGRGPGLARALRHLCGLAPASSSVRFIGAGRVHRRPVSCWCRPNEVARACGWPATSHRHERARTAARACVFESARARPRLPGPNVAWHGEAPLDTVFVFYVNRGNIMRVPRALVILGRNTAKFTFANLDGSLFTDGGQVGWSVDVVCADVTP